MLACIKTIITQATLVSIAFALVCFGLGAGCAQRSAIGIGDEPVVGEDATYSLGRPTVPMATQAEPIPKECQIRIMVAGSVNQPGSVILSEGSIVGDALTAAGGLTRIAQWSRSRIIRKTADGSPQKILFGEQSREQDRLIPLLNDDVIEIWHEVY